MAVYRYQPLRTVNRWLAVLLVPPAILSVVGLIHGAGIFLQMQEFAPQLPGTGLPGGYREDLRLDGWLRFSQITLTLWALTFFCTAWLYLAHRNLLALLQPAERSLRRSLQLFASLMLGICFALRMFQRLWRESQPCPSVWRQRTLQNWQAERWLVPLWWADLIAANVCKIAAVYHFSGAETVAQMVGGYYLMLAAYALYLPLYYLTWRLAWRVEYFQQQVAVQQAARLPAAAQGV